jgi:hypothetical protein
MKLFNPAMAEAIGMANNQPQTTIQTVMNGEEKQKRMELLTLIKAHADLIATTLLIVYLGYSLYTLNKKASK